MTMNKDDFVKELSRTEKVSLGEAGKMVDAVLGGIIRVTKNKGGVKFVGFGNFEKAKRKGRVGRNPQTGARINIPEAVVPKFKPGKVFEDAVSLKGKAAEAAVAAAEAATPAAAKPPGARKAAVAN